MRKLIILGMLVFGMVAVNIPAKAQVSVQININSQPDWGPSGYDYAQFYYFPDYNFYYDINRKQYIIFRNNVWVYVNKVPRQYSFNPYNAYKVVINQNKPYLYNKSHKSKYMQYRGKGKQQPMIRDNKGKNLPRRTGTNVNTNRPNGGKNNSGNHNKQDNNYRTTTRPNTSQNNNRQDNDNRASSSTNHRDQGSRNSNSRTGK